MKGLQAVSIGVLLMAVLAVFGTWNGSANEATAAQAGRVAPVYQVDPFWPNPLPNQWLLGQVAGIDVDSEDHIWLIQRPGSLTEDERGLELGRSICCRPAPPVMEFDVQGNLLNAWGGPASCVPEPGVNPVIGGECYEWPVNEHGIFVDGLGNVWLAGNGENDHQVLKFSQDGTFLMQIGRAGVTGGDDDTMHLGQPADITVDLEAQEVYVSDGYLNHRVIVFDSETGEYKRHWGAYGLPPGDPNAASQFGNPVHCVIISEEGLVYVCDRVNNRVQVFEKGGTYLREFFIRPETLGLGSTWDLHFSPDSQQRFLFDADGENNVVWVLDSGTEAVIGQFGRNGRYAGQFHWVHNLALDSRGNIYTAEVDTAKRAQKFRLVGLRRVDS